MITYSISALDTLNQSTYSNIYFIEIKPLNERYQNRIGHLTELTVDGSLLELLRSRKMLFDKRGNIYHITPPKIHQSKQLQENKIEYKKKPNRY